MKFYDTGEYEDYSHIVAIGKKSGGNETVGDMWTEAKSFTKSTPVDEIIQWAKERDIGGDLTIVISEPEKLPVQF